MNWKRHKLVWMMYCLIVIISLVIALSISSTLMMWGLTYSVLSVSGCIAISWYIRFFNESNLERLTLDRQANRKKIKTTSIMYSMLSSFCFVIPCLIWIILSAIKMNVFDPYMLLASYIAFMIGYYICIYLENKRMGKKLNDQGKDMTCLKNENEMN